MTNYPVLILPAIALLMVIFLPLFGRDGTTPTNFRSRRRRKVLLGRLSVLVLVLATIATLAWPIRGMNSLIQGVLLSALVLVPAFIFHLMASLHYGSGRPEMPLTNATGENEWFTADHDFYDTDDSVEAQTLGFSGQPESSDAVYADSSDGLFGNKNLPVIDLTDVATLRPNRSAQSFKTMSSTLDSDSLLNRTGAGLSGIPTRDVPSANDSPEDDVQSQMEQVEKLVQSHDIGAREVTFSDIDIQQEQADDQPVATPITENQDLVNLEVSKDELDEMTSVELSSFITTLQKDKSRLQKLVIAQHAVIESERESHNRSRDVARDAIKIMRDAQSGQRMAEKVARRERTERQRVEREYERVANVLQNAMSMISVKQETSNVV